MKCDLSIAYVLLSINLKIGSDLDSISNGFAVVGLRLGGVSSSMLILNEKIKASEVRLKGLQGEDLGIVPTSEALQMAKSLKVDLVCESLMSSPPPCRLIRAGAAKEEAQQERKREREPKLKEIRLSPQIEDHDLDTKK